MSYGRQLYVAVVYAQPNRKYGVLRRMIGANEPQKNSDDGLSTRLDWVKYDLTCGRNNHSMYADLLTWEVDELELDLAVGLTATGLH